MGVPLALALFAALAAVGAVHLIRLIIRSDPGESLWFDFLVGVPLSGTVFFLVACFSTAAPIMSAVLFAAAASGAAAVISRVKRPVSTGGVEGSAIRALATSAIILQLAGAAIVAQLPASSLDEVAYHLTVPKTWVLEGRVVDLPLLSHSYFPFGSESAAIPALALIHDQGAAAAHFLNVAIVLTIWRCLDRWLRSKCSPMLASLMAAAILTTPAIAMTAGFAWADWPLLGTVIALLVTIDRSIRAETFSKVDLALAIAAGLLTKYTFIVVLAPLLVGLFAVAPADRRRRIIAATAIGCCGGSVFFLRNALLTGNPVSPFFDRYAPAVTQFRARMIDYIFDRAILDESLGPGLLIIIAAGIASSRVWKRDRFIRAAGVSLGIATLALLAIRPSARILVPPLACIALLLGPSTDSAIGSRRWLRNSFGALILTVVVLQLALVIYAWSSMKPLTPLIDHLTDEQYLSRGFIYRQVVWVNSHLPPDSRALVVGLNELFWFDARVRGGGNFDGPRISAYLADGSPDDLRKRLARDGITHVALFARGLEPVVEEARERYTRLSPAALKNLTEVVRNHATFVDAIRPAAVYRLQE
jgi:hypothetical protein